MEPLEATTRIIEAYLSQPTQSKMVRNASGLKNGAADIAKAFKIIFEVVNDLETNAPAPDE